MSNLLIGLLAAALSTNPPAALTNLVTRETGVTLRLPPKADPNDPIEQEYRKIMEDDDAAQDEVDKWIQQAREAKERGDLLPEARLNGRIGLRFGEVRKSYENFLLKHPNHTRARIAYGSFLNDIQEEEEAVAQWEKAREMDPKEPSAWNNLANHYGHRGPVKKAFEYYAEAMKISPDEPVYLQNLATTVYLFRKDAMEFYGINETEVFNKSLNLYRKALELDPKNFPLATDFAQSYYGIKPLRTREALDAWEYALKIANDDVEREGVYLHMARVELNSGMFAEARRHIDMVSHTMYDVLKSRLAKNLSEKEARRNGTPDKASTPSNPPAQGTDKPAPSTTPQPAEAPRPPGPSKE